MLQSSNIQITSDFGAHAEIVLGKERKINFFLSNISSSQKAFNVSAELIIADGLDLSSSTPAYTKVVQDVGRRYTLTSFKDFSPLEGGVSLAYVMRSLSTYLNGSSIPFGKLTTATLSITWDSMPRGNYDDGNEQYFNIFSFSMTAIRLSVTKYLPAKRVKGAGDADTAASKPFACVTEIVNNTRETATFTIDDFLPNGFRYLGGYSVLTPTQPIVPEPKLITDSLKNLQTLHWDTFILGKGETLKFQYSAAIYDRYMQGGIFNSGKIILHNTSLSGLIRLTTTLDTPSSDYSITAMDMVLSVSQDRSIIDCGDTVSYTLLAEANQYHDLIDITVHALSPDGQIPVMHGNGIVGRPDEDFHTPIDYALNLVTKNTSQSLPLSTLVMTNYLADNDFLSCGDQFTLSVTATGENADTMQTLSDSASAIQSIVLPKITKVISGRYYRNTLPKNVPALAPLDYIDYELTYDSTNIRAAQLGIVLDDFFPLDSSIPDTQSITVLSGVSVEPLPIEPHGLRWILGTVAAESVWKIRLRSQISSVLTSSYTVNLFKLGGQTHSGRSYSQRTNVPYQTGTPNITVNRSLSGISVNKVESGMRYSASITFTNQQNTSFTTTDAFHFDALASIGGGVAIDPATIQLSGSGLWGEPTISTDQVSLPISRLKVGEFITIAYQAVIPDNIPPAYSALLSSQLEIPYSQPFSIAEVNAQYKMNAVMSSFSLRSASLRLDQSFDSDVKQVGGTIDYTVIVTIPRGTAIFDTILADTLPNQQSYTQTATVNGVPVTAAYQNQVVTFPSQNYLFDATRDLRLTYHMTALIDDADITSADVLQRNLCQLSYADKDGMPLFATAYQDVTISNPLLKLFLSGTPDSFSSTSATALSLNITNVGKVNAVGVVVKATLPVEVQYESSSASSGVPAYDAKHRQLILSLPSIAAAQSVILSYLVKGLETVRVGAHLRMDAQTAPYTNQLSAVKQYPAVLSNSYILTAYPAALLSIYPPYRSQSGNGYVQVSANSTAIVPYTLVNKGDGVDSFRLSISPSKYPYDIQIGGSTVAKIPLGTAYSGQPAAFTDLVSGGMCTFRLVFAVPQVQMYDRNPYTVVVESLFDSTARMSNNTEMVDP